MCAACAPLVTTRLFRVQKVCSMDAPPPPPPPLGGGAGGGGGGRKASSSSAVVPVFGDAADVYTTAALLVLMMLQLLQVCSRSEGGSGLVRRKPHTLLRRRHNDARAEALRPVAARRSGGLPGLVPRFPLRGDTTRLEEQTTRRSSSLASRNAPNSFAGGGAVSKAGTRKVGAPVHKRGTKGVKTHECRSAFYIFMADAR